MFIHYFKRTLCVKIRTLVAWLKSTLLLKIQDQDIHIFMKTECLQTKWDAALFGNRKDRVALIKTLIHSSLRGAL